MLKDSILIQEEGLDLQALPLLDQVFLKIVQRKVKCKEISKGDTAGLILLSRKSRAKYTTWSMVQTLRLSNKGEISKIRGIK